MIMILQPKKSVAAAPSVCNQVIFLPKNLAEKARLMRLLAAAVLIPLPGQHHEGNYFRCCFRGYGRCAGERVRSCDRGEARPL